MGRFPSGEKSAKDVIVENRSLILAGLLALGIPEGEASYSAAYWLQSSDRVTEDYAARIWDDLAPHPQTWVLATVLFDTPIDLRSDQARDLFSALRETIHSGLASR